MPIAGTFRKFINWVVFILIVHFLLKHLLLHNNFKNNELEQKEEFSEYCNKILADGYIDTASSSNMKNELQRYIEDKNFFENDNKNEIEVDATLSGIDNLETTQASPNFSNENTNLNNFFESNPVKSQCYHNNEPKNDKMTKESTLNNEFNKPDMWLYDNENIMNGGSINDNLVAFDNFNSDFASFDDSNIITKC